MEIPEETLRRSLGGISDEELLKRWEKRLFTDEALPIAAAEIDRRGLDTSAAALHEIHQQDESLANSYKAYQRAKVWRGLLKAILILAAFVVSTIGAMVIKAALR